MGRRRSTPSRPDPPPTGVLDWSDTKQHWRRTPRPCRYQCGGWPTQLRDGKGKPAHKVCAELAVAQQIQDEMDKYQNERLRLQ